MSKRNSERKSRIKSSLKKGNNTSKKIIIIFSIIIIAIIARIGIYSSYSKKDNIATKIVKSIADGESTLKIAKINNGDSYL